MDSGSQGISKADLRSQSSSCLTQLTAYRRLSYTAISGPKFDRLTLLLDADRSALVSGARRRGSNPAPTNQIKKLVSNGLELLTRIGFEELTTL